MTTIGSPGAPYLGYTTSPTIADLDATFLAQGVPVVADATARDAAYPAPGTNQRVFRLDTRTQERWTGTAWMVDFTPAFEGTGIPEGVLTAPAPALYTQLDAIAGRQLWMKTAGSDAFGWVRLIPPILGPQPGNYWAAGDSFTVGNGASPTAKAYVNVLGSSLGAEGINNIGVSGTGVYTAVADLYNLGTTLPSTGSLATWMAGFNDLRRGGAATKTLAKIQQCLNAFVACWLSTKNVAADDASVTPSGSWTTFAPSGAITRGGVIGGHALSGSTGATLSWTFSGDSLVIGTWASDGSTHVYGPATITVDGTVVTTANYNGLTDGIADSAYDNTQVPAALVLRGLGSGSHTVVVAPTTSSPFIVDYFATLQAIGSAQPILCAMPCRMNATGYAQAPALASDSVMATAAASILAILDQWVDFPVRAVFPNAYYNLATDVYTDNIHPNNSGHGHLAQAFRAALLPMSIPAFPGTGTNSLKLGRASSASGSSATAVGDSAAATGSSSTAVGKAASAASSNAVAVGTNATATGTGAGNQVVIGSGATAYDTDAVAIGTSAVAGTNGDTAQIDVTAVGNGAQATKVSSTAVGSAAASTADNTTTLGKGATASVSRATALGAVATAAESHATAVGCLTNVASTHTQSTAIGYGATTTAANQMMLGTATETAVMPGGAQVGGTGKSVGFYGTAPGVKPTVTGSKGANAALASLLTALATLGLVTDSST